MEKTYEQMLTLAQGNFGENSTVRWDERDDCWVINTDMDHPDAWVDLFNDYSYMSRHPGGYWMITTDIQRCSVES